MKIKKKVKKALKIDFAKKNVGMIKLNSSEQKKVKGGYQQASFA